MIAHAALALLLLALTPAEAQLMLPQIFKDGVVLQHTKPVVFGYAAPGETVTVKVTPAGGGGAVSVSAVVSDGNPSSLPPTLPLRLMPTRCLPELAFRSI